MRRPKIVRESGPYTVKSLANGVLEVHPSWPQCSEWTEDGGGPGLISRLTLAGALEDWLNASYKEKP